MTNKPKNISDCCDNSFNKKPDGDFDNTRFDANDNSFTHNKREGVTMNRKQCAHKPYDRSFSTVARGIKFATRAMPALSLGITGAFAALPAHSAALEEVVVTARKQSESMQEVPIAISSFNGEALQEMGAAGLTDVATHTPNLNFTMSASSDSTIKPAIRGQSQTDNVMTLDQSVGIYVDDVIWPRPVGANMNLTDINHVEVLRGPQGTLFGRNTTGGAVLTYTNNPAFAREARVGVNLGNYNRTDYNFMVNTPIVEDKLAFRLAYDAEKRDGWQKDKLSDKETAQKDTKNIIAKLLLQPSDDMELLLKLDRSEGDYYMPEQVVTYFSPTGAPAYGGADPWKVFSGGTKSAANFVSTDYEHPSTGSPNRPKTEYVNQGVSLTGTWKMAQDITVKAVGAYRELNEWTEGTDYDNSPFPILTVDIGLQGHRMWSGELQVNGVALDDRLNWTAGLFAFQESGRDESYAAFGAPIMKDTRADIKNSSQALFTQANYKITDALTATLGLRYSRESKDMTAMSRAVKSSDRSFAACIVPSVFTGVADITNEAGCRANFSRDDSSVDYSAMLAYNIDKDKMVYVKTATGFRSGGQNLRGGILGNRDSATSVASFRDFAPETVTEYEIGLKAEWFDSRLRTNLAAFYSDYKDIQRSTLIATPGGGVATVVANAAAGTVQGVEAEINGIITPAWRAGATFGWVDAKYDKYNDLNQAGNVVDRSGEPFPNTPEYNYSLWSSYTVDLPVGKATARIDYSWVDKHYTFATQNTTGSDTPAEGLANARLQWDVSPSFLVALWCKNLTNNVYRSYGLELFDSYGFATGIGNPPRMYGLEMSYRFKD